METLLLFIKNPVLGKVKTRIAQTAGEVRALQIYLEMLRHTREVALSADARRFLFYSDFINDADSWHPSSFEKYLQQGNDLGERMQHAFETAFAQGASKAVIIGSDCVDLTGAIVKAAFRQLDDHSFVIGPTLDGGYYLLGMNALEPTVFDNIQWSTATVLPTTLERIQSLQKNYFLLPALPDIDYEADWEQFGWEI